MKLDAQWIVGFVDGEGCFHVAVNSNTEMSLGAQVLPEFSVVQHERDVQVLHALKSFFGCGVVRKNNGDRMAYRVRGHEHLAKTVIPFFEEHPLKTRKQVEFLKFRDIVKLMEQREHLTQRGLERIRAICEQMNRKGLKIKSDHSGNGLD